MALTFEDDSDNIITKNNITVIYISKRGSNMYCIAIDTGGSKTLASILDHTGETLKTGRWKGCGLPVDRPGDPLPEFQNALLDFSKDFSPIDSILVNLGGRNRGQLQAVLEQLYPKAQIQIYRESEGYLAKALAKHHGASAVLLAGTGAIAVSFHPSGTSYVGGGWGADIGDGGSGYDIGLQAVRRSLLELDRNQKLSLLTQKITGCGEPLKAEDDLAVLMEKRDEIRKELLPLNRRKIAALAPIVAECAAQNDAAALNILKEAGQKLAVCVSSCLLKTGIQPPSKIIITGGLLHIRPYWDATFRQTLSEMFGECGILALPDGIWESAKHQAVMMGKETIEKGQC